MPNRLRLVDFKNSRGPQTIGICGTNTEQVASVVNTAQRRLILAPEAGDEGWWGTWAEIAFSVDPSNPYVTLPRELARFVKVDVLKRPIRIENQFYEYLQFGCGKRPGWNNDVMWTYMGSRVYERNNVATFRDITSAPQNIFIYPSNAFDVGKTVLVQGTDSLGNIITSLDPTSGVTIQGVRVALATPFVSVPLTMSSITGIQKDITLGNITIAQSDPITSVLITLGTMEPGEQVASYRRYYFDRPTYSMVNGVPVSQVTAIAKLELVPAVSDSDYLLIQNLEALIEECQAIRYSMIDTVEGKTMAAQHHKHAIRYLQGELVHYLGKERPALSFKPFGADDLYKQNIGRMI
jgi:hypothetical protein